MKKKGKTPSTGDVWSCAAHSPETVAQQTVLSKKNDVKKSSFANTEGEHASIASLCSHVHHSSIANSQSELWRGLHFQLYCNLNKNKVTYLFKAAQEKPCVDATSINQAQSSLSKYRFINMLMNNGKRDGAYQTLLDSINTCKSKIFEKRVLVYKHTSSTKSSKILSPVSNKDVALRTQHLAQQMRGPKAQTHTSASNAFRLHASVEQAIGTAKLALSLQNWVTPKQQSKRYLQSNQICGKTAYNVEPIVETRKVRVRGNTYQVPATLHFRRRERISIRWVITNARSKRESLKEALFQSLGQELFDCINRQSISIQKRDQMYKLAANSRVYMRYKWW